MKSEGYLKFGALVGIAISLSACGSGETTPKKDFGVFHGNTSAAAITSENAQAMVGMGLASANRTNLVAGFSIATRPKSYVQHKGHSFRKLSGRAEEIQNGDSSNNETQSNGDTRTHATLADLLNGFNIEGDCGGTMAMKMTNAESVQMSIIYDQYCTVIGKGENAKRIQNGHMSMVSASADDVTYEVDITTKSEMEDSLLRATMREKDLASGGREYHIDLESTDSITKQSLKLENIHLIETDNSFSLSGRVYDDKDGYVDIETVQPIKTDSSGIPFEGKMVVKGADNSSATLEISGDTYTVSIDNNGDGKADSTVSGKSSDLADTADDATLENNENTTDETSADQTNDETPTDESNTAPMNEQTNTTP